MEKMLKGIKVLSFSLAAAGPTTAQYLRNMGATVIHVEPPAGCSTRNNFSIEEKEWNLGGTRSIAINAKDPKGYEVLTKLIQDCDVFISNYRERALVKLKLDHDTVMGINPRIVYGMLYGYGPTGPQKDDPGYDTTCFWAKGGLMRDIVEPGTVVVPPIAVGDDTASTALAMGICAALYNRTVTGKGTFVSSSIFAMSLFLNNDAIMASQKGEKYPKSRKLPIRSLLNSYQAGDGEWISMNANNHVDENWPFICKIIGREDLADKYHTSFDTMNEHAPEIVEVLDEGFKKFTRDELVAKLKECPTISVEPVQSSADTINDPQAEANNYFIDHTLADGRTIKMPACPVKFGDNGANEVGPVPELGHDTRDILASLGYSEEEVNAMIESKAVLAEN